METNLQFDRAEFRAPATMTCSGCKATLTEAYYAAGSAIFCGTCAENVRAHFAGSGSRAARVTRALLYGLGAGILGALLYYGVLALTGYEVGLVAIVVGVLVGKAVRKGSGGRGGWRYQIIAALLTYASIAATYVPLAIGELREHKSTGVPTSQTQNAGPGSEATAAESSASAASQPKPVSKSAPSFLENLPSPLRFVAASAMLLALALSLPIVVGTSSPITLLIVGFGVWEAWRLNKRAVIAITGPHAIAPAASA